MRTRANECDWQECTRTAVVKADGLQWCAIHAAMIDIPNGQRVPPEKPDERDVSLELAWGVIANVSGGNWEQQSPEWQEAAAKWRDRVMPGLSERMAERLPAGHEFGEKG